MSDINFLTTYQLDESYESIKERAFHMLEKYWEYPDLIKFNDSERSVTFKSERLIPVGSTNRPRVMLLFSNPHPHSVHQGMFLSPNTKGKVSLFWPVMRDAGWLIIKDGDDSPKQKAEICFGGKYRGPFEFIFYCYYAFPTDYPEDIKKIFGREYFNRLIAPDSLDEFRKMIQDTSVDAVVTFNKGIFNLVSNDPVERYIERLKGGGLIHSRLKGIERSVPIYLTYPTGWFFHKEFRELRRASLDGIRTAILGV